MPCSSSSLTSSGRLMDHSRVPPSKPHLVTQTNDLPVRRAAIAASEKVLAERKGVGSIAPLLKLSLLQSRVELSLLTHPSSGPSGRAAASGGRPAPRWLRTASGRCAALVRPGGCRAAAPGAGRGCRGGPSATHTEVRGQSGVSDLNTHHPPFPTTTQHSTHD